MIDLFLYIACSENEQQYYMHILEVRLSLTSEIRSTVTGNITDRHSLFVRSPLVSIVK
jgi:hypothetical protein